MEYEFRLGFFEYYEKVIKISNIAKIMTHFFLQFRGFKIAWHARRIKRITNDVGAKFFEPDRQPRTFKASMPSNKDVLVLINIIEHIGDQREKILNDDFILTSLDRNLNYSLRRNRWIEFFFPFF